MEVSSKREPTVTKYNQKPSSPYEITLFLHGISISINMIASYL